MDKLKILLWSPKGAGNHYYGPGKNALTLYKEIKKQATVEIALIHAYPNHEKSDVFENIHQIGDYNKNNIFDFLIYLIKSTKILLKYRNKGYIFHGLDVYSYIFIPALIAKFLGYPVALKVAAHPSGFSSSKSSIILFIRRSTIRFIDKFFAISHEIVDELRGLKVGKSKIELVFNGVNIPNLKEFNNQKLSNGSRVILFTGSIVKRKRPHILIEAIAKSKNPKAWALHLVGPIDDKPYFHKMEAMIKTFGLSDQVTFHGFKDDLSKFYMEADLYALPSLSEGMPNGVLEAMSYSLPILISDFSSAHILCDNTNGYIVNSLQEMVDCLNLFTENLNYFDIKGLNSYELVCDSFEISKISKKYISIFDQI